jgi:threonine aldolase
MRCASVGRQRLIDLYSDTMTRPTQAMREFMCRAPVGDEQRGEDPTVNRLQETVAELLGKDAAVFVPSATMANQIALKCHTQPGDEIIAEARSHVIVSEVGGPAFHSGVMVRPVAGERGTFTAEQVAVAMNPPERINSPPTRLVWIENTHNYAGGAAWPPARLAAVATFARGRGLAVHVDGARLLNAALATDTSPAALAAHADTVTLCLSKGLGCPGGALLAGAADLIRRARKYKQLFGGSMRQAGILAAAGVYALEHHVDRLREDHDNARRLARGLAAIAGLRIDAEVDTNMVYFVCEAGLDPNTFYDRCLAEGVRFSRSGNRFRAVTHLDVNVADIDEALATVRRVVAGEGPLRGNRLRAS